MSDPAYDGLCGIPSPFTTGDGLHLRCRFEIGHGGDHDWKRHEGQFRIQAGVFRSDMIRWFYPVPKGCTCQPLRADDGTIVEYVFRPDCPAHNKEKA